MSTKIGRPKSDNPMNNSIKIRFDENTSKQLDEYATLHGIKRTEVVRRGLKMILESSGK